MPACEKFDQELMNIRRHGSRLLCKVKFAQTPEEAHITPLFGMFHCCLLIVNITNAVVIVCFVNFATLVGIHKLITMKSGGFGSFRGRTLQHCYDCRCQCHFSFF
jgi:hypothetical protein